ncbi:MAG: thiamine pyrophosphate-dependent dehydrogenase E1 component subunit alpha [Gemmataceae bacterium]
MPEQSADEEPPEGRAGGPRRSGASISPAAVVRTGREAISAELALTLYRQMVRTRALEERSIKMSKSGEAFFWIGGPGEEAFNVCLGRQVLKGRGPAYDYLHLHYRNAGTMLAMGMSMTDHLRQLAMRATDRHSRGRNFVGHYCVPEWNVLPVSSVIEVQHVMAPGTALVQKRHGGEGISVVVGGDAGTAEGDFESCLNWATQPGNSLPVLMIVTNNRTGISTPFETVHTRRPISDRALPYGVDSATVDGTDPVVVWHALDRAMRVCRQGRKPYLLEVMVSRMHGHSSSSGAQRDWAEADPVALFEQRLIDAAAIDADGVRQLREEARAEADAAAVEATSEPHPSPADLYRDTFAPSPVDAVYPGDYTGLPR